MNEEKNQLSLHENSICVTDDGIEKREFGEQKNVINAFQNLTALSNRRSKGQNLPPSFKLNWSIDRITLVGFFK